MTHPSLASFNLPGSLTLTLKHPSYLPYSLDFTVWSQPPLQTANSQNSGAGEAIFLDLVYRANLASLTIDMLRPDPELVSSF